jgi:hypothetical protein
MSRKLVALIAVLAAAATLVAAPSNAAKPSPPTLSVTFPSALASASSGTPYGTPFLVSGCGYGGTYTSVVVRSPEALSFAGQAPDAQGCISFSNFSTNAPGRYQVDAYQQLHGRSAVVASTTFWVS